MASRVAIMTSFSTASRDLRRYQRVVCHLLSPRRESCRCRHHTSASSRATGNFRLRGRRNFDLAPYPQRKSTSDRLRKTSFGRKLSSPDHNHRAGFRRCLASVPTIPRQTVELHRLHQPRRDATARHPTRIRIRRPLPTIRHRQRHAECKSMKWPRGFQAPPFSRDAPAAWERRSPIRQPTSRIGSESFGRPGGLRSIHADIEEHPRSTNARFSRRSFFQTENRMR